MKKLLSSFIKSLLKKQCTYRVVVPSCKPSDDTGGTVQKQWLRIGSSGLYTDFESLHNPEYKIANKMISNWKALQKLVVEYDEALEKRRGRVADVGTSTDGHMTRGQPYQDPGYMFEFKKLRVPKPNKDVLEQVLYALNRYRRSGGRCITGRNVPVSSILKELHKEGKHQTLASSDVTGHTQLSDETFTVEGVDIDKIVNKPRGQDNNQGKKQNNQQGGHSNNRRGYFESDD